MLRAASLLLKAKPLPLVLAVGSSKNLESEASTAAFSLGLVKEKRDHYGINSSGLVPEVPREGGEILP
jgi:hypothetical protein